MRPERRFRWAVLSACALHALLLIGTSLHRPNTKEQPSLLVQPGVLDIELSLRGPIETPRAHEKPDRGSTETRQDGPEQQAYVHRSAQPSARAPSEDPVTQESAGEFVGREQEPLVYQSGPGTQSGTAPGKPGRGGLLPPRTGLGDDFRLAYALSQQEKAPNATERAADNLRRSMQQEQADYERKLGLNVPAPLILAIESAARDVAIPVNSVAVFTANIDGSGQLLELEFAGSNHASPQWNKLTQRVEQMLRGRKLPIAKNVKGVDLRLRLVARAQLPSGADPGLGVDLLGVPVKKGQGKRSSKITILDPIPKVLELEVPGTNGQEKVKLPVPGVVVSVLNVAGDPGDIGAPARQMVRVEVLDEKVH